MVGMVLRWARVGGGGEWAKLEWRTGRERERERDQERERARRTGKEEAGKEAGEGGGRRECVWGGGGGGRDLPLGHRGSRLRVLVLGGLLCPHVQSQALMGGANEAGQLGKVVLIHRHEGEAEKTPQGGQQGQGFLMWGCDRVVVKGGGGAGEL